MHSKSAEELNRVLNRDVHGTGRDGDHHHHQHARSSKTKGRQHPSSSSSHRVSSRMGPTSDVKFTPRADDASTNTREEKLKQDPIGLVHNLGLRASGRISPSGRSFIFEDRSFVLEPRGSSTIALGAGGGTLVLIFLIFLGGKYKARRKLQDEKEENKIMLLNVFKYLLKFDLEDVDMEVSPSGGILVGYKNELAEGVNNKLQSESPQSSDSQTESDSSPAPKQL